MKVSINIPGAGQVYVSGAAEVVNRKALCLSLIHISEPTRRLMASRMPSSA